MNCLVVASFNIDMIYDVDDFPKSGQTIFAQSYKILPGGKGNNVLRFLSKLYNKVDVLGALGDDVNKNIILNDLHSRNIQTNYIQIYDDSYTGTATIYVNSKGKNTIVVNPGANWKIQLDKVNKNFFGNYDKIFMSMENSLQTAKDIFKLCKGLNKETILNFSPSKYFDEELFLLTDFLVLNNKEYQDIIEQYKVKNEIELIKKFNLKKLIVTYGKKGSMFINDQGQKIQQKALQSNVIDTTGAGDSFLAGFLSGYLQNFEIKNCMQFGAKYASYCIQLKGVQVPECSFEELQKCIE